MSSTAETFAKWAIGLDYENIPDQTIHISRRAIFDTIGVMAAAQAHPMTKTLRTASPHHTGSCSVVGSSDLLCMETAALVNGAAAHVWDFDDTSYTGVMHGSAVVLPCVLALTQHLQKSEEEMIAAFAAGSEVTYTLAQICSHSHYFDGWWSTITQGLIGATAAAAKLLDLTVEQASHAIGLAAASSGGGKCLFGSDGKPLMVGETARRAINFAQLAAAGLTGPLNAFEDSRGYFSLLNKGKADLSELSTLGQIWRLCEPGLLFKTSPVCSAAHAAIDQTATLARQLEAEPDQIKAIKLEIPELVRISLVYDNPVSPQEAQFSLPYAVCCAVLYGKVRLEDLSDQELTDPVKAQLRQKISIATSARLSSDEMRAKYPESASVRIEMTDGRIAEDFCGEAYGMPNRPLSDASLIEKFRDCLTVAGIQAPADIRLSDNLIDLASFAFRQSNDQHLQKNAALKAASNT